MTKNFETLSRKFGTHASFLRRFPLPEQSMFSVVAKRLHESGLDWWLAQGYIFFGVKDVEQENALFRLGRIWSSELVTINTRYETREDVYALIESALRKLGYASARTDRHFEMTLSQFVELMTPEFLAKLAKKLGVKRKEGNWPTDYAEVEEPGPCTLESIYDVFNGRFSYAQLALVQRGVKAEEFNEDLLEHGITRWWASPTKTPDIVVLHFKGRKEQQVWAGRYLRTGQVNEKGKVELLVKKFELIGIHRPLETTAADFYRPERADGGSRVYVQKVDNQVSRHVENTCSSNRDGYAYWYAKVRKGQPEFRGKLLKAWNRQCAVTGCRVEPLLEAAHINPYSNGGDYRPCNGLLLRADIHALFDSNLLSVDGKGRVHVSNDVSDPTYAGLRGVQVRLPFRQPWEDELRQALAVRHAEVWLA